MYLERLIPVLKFLRNKFVIASLAFITWMTFFDDKSIGFMYDNIMKLRDLKKSEKNIESSIVKTKEELSLLNTNAKSVEKYAREKFYMKKQNEELFITDIK